MEKLGFRGTRNLDQFKCVSGTLSRTSPLNVRLPSESQSSGSFANLKTTAEKLVKEHASAKSDLEMANLKLKKSTDFLRTLEDKLQLAYNENAKLNVKQREDDKLWKGLDSKFYSTKILNEQLSETIQQMTGIIQNAEKDKAHFEDRLSASSIALENLHNQLKTLSSKLVSAEQTTIICNNNLNELKMEKEEREAFFNDEKCRMDDLIKVKDSEIMQFEATLAANKLTADSLSSKIDDLHLQIRSKEDSIMDLSICHKNLQEENSDLRVRCDHYAEKLTKSHRKIKELKDLLDAFAKNLFQLDKQSSSFSDQVVKLKSVYDTLIKLLQQEGNLISKRAQQKYDELHAQFMHKLSENNELDFLNLELRKKVSELQKIKEFTMIEHAKECRLAEERIHHLEGDAQILLSKKDEMEIFLFDIEKKNELLSESSKLCEKEKQELLEKLSTVEIQNKCAVENLQSVIQQKIEETDTLQKKIEKHEQHVCSLEARIREMDSIFEEKEQLAQQHKDEQRNMEIQIEELRTSLAAAESKNADDKVQYDVMLENQQQELSRHLNEISLKNDQAINEFRQKFEMEKLEIVSHEKEKVENLINLAERRCEEKLTECINESDKKIMKIQEEHASLVHRIQQEHEREVLDLKAEHSEVLRQNRIAAEDELREKTMQVKNEFEVQIKALIHQHEDDCANFKEELLLQKSKEDKQRALLQMQWKVMGVKPQEDQEVNSKKVYSISSARPEKSNGGKRSQLVSLRENKGVTEGSPLVKASQSRQSNMLKKAVGVKTNSANPKQRRKVTHHEYEVETSNGQTVTKRRKTKSTVMYADPSKTKTIRTPKPKTLPTAKTPPAVVMGLKANEQSRTFKISDLFSDGSLNPYDDDPYTFK